MSESIDLEKKESYEVFRKAMTFIIEDCLCRAGRQDPNHHDCEFFVRNNGDCVEFVNRTYRFGFEEIRVINKDDNMSLLMHTNKGMVFRNNKGLSEEEKQDINNRHQAIAIKILGELRSKRRNQNEGN